MVFPDFDPIAIHLGPLGIHWYGLAYVAGLAFGGLYVAHLIKTSRLWQGSAASATPRQINDLAVWIAFGVIVGGRIGYILFYDLGEMLKHPLEMLEVWHGGMSFHGGFLGVTLAIVGFSLANKLNMLKVSDLIAPVVPIGLFFGRIANFINGELWGRPTHLPWGMVFCNARIEAANQGSCPAGMLVRHPSQLYEAGLEGIVLFLVLLWATHKAKWLNREGAVTGLFLAGYGLARVGLENVRQPDQQMPYFPLGLTMGMMLSIPMILAGIWLIWRGLRKPPAPPQRP